MEHRGHQKTSIGTPGRPQKLSGSKDGITLAKGRMIQLPLIDLGEISFEQLENGERREAPARYQFTIRPEDEAKFQEYLRRPAPARDTLGPSN